MVERAFFLRFFRTALEIGSGFALNVGATFATENQLPLAALVTGAAAALLATQSTVDHLLTAAEQRQAEDALASLTRKHGSLRAAVEAIANQNEERNQLSADKARLFLELAGVDAEAEQKGREDQEALIIYVGRWLEQWCNGHGKDFAEFRKQFSDEVAAIKDELRTLASRIDEAMERDDQRHTATQDLVTRIHPFLKAIDYFKPFVDPNRIFRHDWSLVGRDLDLDELVRFAKAGPERVSILPGRGGIGKSKLLHALVQRLSASGSAIFFAHERVSLAGLTQVELPPENALLVVDDAHRYEDLPSLLEILQAHRPTVRVLLVTRPHAVGYLRSTVLTAKYDVTQLRMLAELKELRKVDVKALAEQALGERFKYLSDLLVEMSWDSPLVTVIAGQLVAREAISPVLLERKHDFRDAVLARFQDELLGHVSPQVPPRECVGVLQVLSAVAPAPIADPRFLSVTAKFLDLSEDAVRTAMTSMEEAGVLLRRGRNLRITPDVLADHVLFNACLQGNEPTRYAERVFSTYFELYPSQVLGNLAELDWRLREAESMPPRLLDEIWQHIEIDYKTSPYRRQCEFLKVLRKVGYLEPDRVLSLVEHSMRDLPADDKQEFSSDWLNATPLSIRRLLPGVLRNVAFHVDYLPRCCDLLWCLGKDDTRALGPNPDHAIRILAEIARYDHRKSVSIHKRLLDRALTWLESPDVHDHAHSVFDVLDALLEKSSYSETSTRKSMLFHPFLIDRVATERLRKAVIAQLKKAVMGGERKTVQRALKSLHNFLLPPTAYFGHPVTEEDKEQWEPEQIEVLDFLVSRAETCADVVRKVQILASMPYYIRTQSNAGIRERVRRLKKLVADDFDVRLALLLMHTSGFDFDDDDENDVLDHEVRRAKKEAQLDDVARKLLERHPSPDSAFDAVDALARGLSDAGISTDAWKVFRGIGKRDPSYGLALAKTASMNPKSPLFSRSDVLLSWSRQADPSSTQRALRELISSPSVFSRRLAAYYLGSWCADMSGAEVDAVGRLLVDPDPGVQDLAIGALVLLRATRPAQAMEICLSVDFGDRSSGAEKFCEVLMKDHKELHEAVTDEVLEQALRKLIKVDTLDGHHVARMVVAACTRVPESVVNLLLSRVRERNLRLNHRPFPCSGELAELKRMASTPKYDMLLRQVRDALLDLGGSGESWIPKLFAWCSGFFAAPESMAALSEWVDSGRTDQIVGAALLVCEAGRHFAFREPRFLERLLERAFERGEECYESVRNRLFIATAFGERHGIAGEPYPQDIEMRNKAVETVKLFDAGSRARQFYEAVEKQAKDNIAAALAEEDDHDV